MFQSKDTHFYRNKMKPTAKELRMREQGVLTGTGFTADYYRFLDLHSWYKHIPLGGVDFYGFIQKGIQPRNSLDTMTLIDPDGDHMWFTRIDPGVDAIKIRLGPFMTANVASGSGNNVRIIDERNSDTFRTWLLTVHPDLIELYDNRSKSSELLELFRKSILQAENNIYYHNFIKAFTTQWPDKKIN